MINIVELKTERLKDTFANQNFVYCLNKNLASFEFVIFQDKLARKGSKITITKLFFFPGKFLPLASVHCRTGMWHAYLKIIY